MEHIGRKFAFLRALPLSPESEGAGFVANVGVLCSAISGGSNKAEQNDGKNVVGYCYLR